MNEDVRMKILRPKRRSAPFVVVAVAAIALAACGSSGSTAKTESSSSTTEQSTTTSTPSTTAAPAAVVETTDNDKLGTLLVDAEGKTLYTLTNSGTAVDCPEACAKFWPPLLLPAGTTSAVGGAGVTGLSTVAGSGGTQVTANGLPLYRFAADSAPGDANGEGISSFGGVWHVVKVSGTPSGSTPDDSAPGSTDASTTTMEGYSY